MRATAISLSAAPSRGDVESASRLLDAIIDRGMTAALAIVDELRRSVRSAVQNDLSLGELLFRSRRVVARYEPLFARTLSDSLLASWLTAGQRVVDRLPVEEETESEPGIILPPPPEIPTLAAAAPDEPEPVVRFPIIEQAARDLAERRVLTKEEFDQLAADANRAAFTVARVSSLDAIEKIQQALVDDVSRGGTLKEFRDRIDDILGTSALSPAHVENVYRTNVGQAYAAGLQEVLNHPLVSDEFPYVAYHAVHDTRTRPEHRQLEKLGIDGTNIYRRDDPVMQIFWPPWDYQCRCAAVPLTIEDAAKFGIREAREWLRTGEPPERPDYVVMPSFRPPAGFDRSARFVTAV